MWDSNQWSRMTLWSRRLAKSLDILKPLYLHFHYHSGYCHQAWHGGDLPIRASKERLLRSCDKLKILYLHCYDAYDYQIWQNGYIQWQASFHKVRRPFYHMFLWFWFSFTWLIASERKWLSPHRVLVYFIVTFSFRMVVENQCSKVLDRSCY